MAKKQDSFYYENFSECAACACQAAHYLEDALKNFKPEGLSSMLDELHQVEHAADEKKHELSNVLARAFITPIEREDIILLSQSIDEITDKIEDVMLRLYCNNVQTIRPDAIEMGAVLIHCCEEVRKLVDEFADFRPLQEAAGVYHPHQHHGGAGRQAVHRQHAPPAHQHQRPHRNHQLARDLHLHGEVRRCLRARRRRRGKRDYEEYLSRSAAGGRRCSGTVCLFFRRKSPIWDVCIYRKSPAEAGLFLMGLME